MSVLVLYIHGKKMTQINHNMLNGCHLPLIFNVMSPPPLILIFKQFVHLPLIFNVLPPPPYINFRRFVHLPLIFHVPLILGIKEYLGCIYLLGTSRSTWDVSICSGLLDLPGMYLFARDV